MLTEPLNANFLLLQVLIITLLILLMASGLCSLLSATEMVRLIFTAFTRTGQACIQGDSTKPGGFLQDRYQKPVKVMLVKRDGTSVQELTSGEPNAGFPSFSSDGKQIVYRVWGGKETGLRIMNLADRSVRILMREPDNVPYWSPTDERIVFTRKANDNFNIYTIRLDGSDLRRLTSSLANDGHAVWTNDGKHILWSSGQPGWKDEAAHYDNTFQPYAAIFMMNADGTEKRQLTDSLWEDAMPCFVPKAMPKIATK